MYMAGDHVKRAASAGGVTVTSPKKNEQLVKVRAQQQAIARFVRPLLREQQDVRSFDHGKRALASDGASSPLQVLALVVRRGLLAGLAAVV